MPGNLLVHGDCLDALPGLGGGVRLVYLDPPYYEKGADLYLNHYQETDHKRLAKKLNAHPDAPWLLTYDNKPEIRKLYPKRKVVKFSLSYNAYELRKGRELMILSDRLAA